MHQRPQPDRVVVASGKSRTLTAHALERVIERSIAREWIGEILTDWVARRWNEQLQTMNYWGFVEGRGSLLRVVVSRDDVEIVTVVFDTPATRRYHRQREGQGEFFDEVRDVPES